ncbi:hypothetical protein VTN02DRAFT_5482 [Thermoascus thermophilus]
MTQSHPPHSTPSHRRTPSSSSANAQKQSSTRLPRPALSRKNTATVFSISKLGPGSGHASWSSKDEERLDMATSFLQFCAMCERQITVPDNALLYCSESCRRKDSRKPLSASFSTTASMSPSNTPPSSPPMSPRVIVPPMTPTKAPVGTTPSVRIPADLHDAKSDLDPTEWKPILPRHHGSSTSLASSEAWQYLSQFHGSSAEVMFPSRRPSAGYRSSASLSTMMSSGGVPSLTHTPSTVASSFASNSDYVSYMHEYANRPLPPRHNPSFSTSSGATKGLELVMPHISAPAADDVTVTTTDSGSIFPARGSVWGKREVKTYAPPMSSMTSAFRSVENSTR